MRLTVKQLKNRDLGSGMAVIDREALGEIGVSSDDFVAIEGRDGGRAVARVWPSDKRDAGREIIRIDGQLRQAANVGIDDRVTVELTDVEPADRVTVALPGSVRIRGDLGSYVRDELADQAVTAGQTVAVSLGFGALSGRSGQRIPLQVVDTEPSGTVVVQQSTDVEVLDQSAEEMTVSRGEAQTSPVESAPTPSVTYEDVGGLDDELEAVREIIELPMRHPELFDKFVGESEKAVREVFEKARANAPTVVFFDEIDAIAAERGSGIGDNNVGERVVSQLLTELDGLEELEDVVVIATTNRPDLIDEALLRPGRLDRHVEVGEPDEVARREIFEIHTRGRPLADDVDLDDLAARTAGLVGADIAAVCREAAQTAVREHVLEGGDPGEIVLTADHFEQALAEVGDGEESEAVAEPA